MNKTSAGIPLQDHGDADHIQIECQSCGHNAELHAGNLPRLEEFGFYNDKMLCVSDVIMEDGIRRIQMIHCRSCLSNVLY